MISEDDRKRVIGGIADYAHEQKVLLRLLRKKGGAFTEQQFDSWFRYSARKYRRYPRFCAFRSNTLMLGFGARPRSSWTFMLDLLQHMILLGLVGVKRDRSVVYHLPTKGSPT